MKKLLFTFLILLAPTLASAATIGKVNSNNIGLVGWWTLDGSQVDWTRGKAIDSSGQGVTGTLVNMSTTSSPAFGKVGQALQFHKNGMRVDLGTTLDSTLNGSTFTISVWFKADSVGDANQDSIFGNRSAVNSRTIGIDWLSTSRLRLGEENIGFVLTNSFNLVNGQWYHAVWTYDNGLNTLYMNGVVDGTIVRVFSGSFNGTYFISDDDLVANSFDGSIDDVRVYSRTLTVNEVRALYNSGSAKLAQPTGTNSPNSSGLVGHWTFDGADTNTTIADKIGGNSGYFIGGATTTAKTTGKIGQALQFDGVDDYASVGASNVMTDAANNYSVSTWFKTTQTSRGIFYSEGSSSDNQPNVNFNIGFPSAGFVDFSFRKDGDAGNGIDVQSPLATYNDGQWHHAVGVRNGANALYLYIDGVLVDSDTATYSGTMTQNRRGIGALLRVSPSLFFAGSVDNTRVYNRALTAQEVKNLFNSSPKIGQSGGSNTPLANGLVGYWTMDGSKINWNIGKMVDSSGAGNTGALVNLGTTTSGTTGKLGQALRFVDANNTGIDLGTPTALNLTGNVTISAWINPATWGGNSRGRILNKDDAVNGYLFWVDNIPGSNTTEGLCFGVNAAAAKGTDFQCTTANTVVLNTWQHVVVVFNALGNTATFYVNGSPVGVQGGLPQDINSNTSVTATIGRRNTDTARNFEGTIDDVRVYNKALSPAEVLQLYNMR